MDRRRKQQRNVPESLLYTMHEEEGVETQKCMEWRWLASWGNMSPSQLSSVGFAVVTFPGAGACSSNSRSTGWLPIATFGPCDERIGCAAVVCLRLLPRWRAAFHKSSINYILWTQIMTCPTTAQAVRFSPTQFSCKRLPSLFFLTAGLLLCFFITSFVATGGNAAILLFLLGLWALRCWPLTTSIPSYEFPSTVIILYSYTWRVGLWSQLCCHQQKPDGFCIWLPLIYYFVLPHCSHFFVCVPSVMKTEGATLAIWCFVFSPWLFVGSLLKCISFSWQMYGSTQNVPFQALYNFFLACRLLASFCLERCPFRIRGHHFVQDGDHCLCVKIANEKYLLFSKYVGYTVSCLLFKMMK